MSEHFSEIRAGGVSSPVRRISVSDAGPLPAGPVIELIDPEVAAGCVVPRIVRINGQDMLVADDEIKVTVGPGDAVKVRLTLMPSRLTFEVAETTAAPEAD